MNKKIISFSLYGDMDMYFAGMLENAKLAPKIFPDWTVRVYCEKSNYGMHILKELGCEVKVKPASQLHSGMFWRFLSAWDSGAERVIFRDADSRLNIKEAAAVRAWEESGLDCHCMKDHPHHAGYPLFGGMWGIKCGVLPNRIHSDCLGQCRRIQKRVADMNWLRDVVHPLVEDSMIRHSSVPTKWPCVDFPVHPEYKGFVGQQFDLEGNAIWPK